MVGDTFPLGCAPSEKIVFSQYFENNPDKDVEAYNSALGVYKEHCGLSNVVMSYGHDEYLYRVLLDSNTKLPAEVCVFCSFFRHNDLTSIGHRRCTLYGSTPSTRTTNTPRTRS